IVTERTRARLVIRDEIEETDADIQAVAGAARTHPLTQVVLTSRRRLTSSTMAVTAAFALAAIAGFAYIFASRHASQSNAAAMPPSAKTMAAGRNTTENPAAREAYLKGRYFWNQRNPDAILKAEQEFESALQIDPNFAPAYAGMADCYLVGGTIPGVLS